MSHKLRLGAIIRNGAKTRSPQNFASGLNNNKKKKKQSKSNMSHKLCLGAMIIRRNGAKTISLLTSFGDLIIIVKKKRRIAIHHSTTVGVM